MLLKTSQFFLRIHFYPQNPYLNLSIYRRKWHEEFIFTLPDSNQAITLLVLDWNRVMKNVPLGAALLEVAKVSPNVGLDMWLPLDTKGEIHIFCQATPLLAAPSKPKSLRLGSFRMNVERTVYFPGELISGAVIYNVGVPKKIRGVRVRFTGETRTMWSEQHGSGDHRRTVTYFGHVVYFNPVATLYGNERGEKKDFKIPSGGYFWPFEFVLPAGIAPSFHHNIGENAYRVTGYVDIPMSIDKTVVHKLTVTCEYAQMHPTLNLKFAKKAKALLAADEKISVALAAPEVAYMGENFPIDVTIDNSQGTKEVKQILIKLKSKYYFTGHSTSEGWKTCKRKKNVCETKVAGIAGFPIPPGQVWSGQIAVAVPPALPPSVPDQSSPLVQVYYQFKATMNTSGNIFTKASNSKKLPVLLGERIPFTPVIFQVTAPIIQIAQAPTNVYQYLAPAPLMGEEVPMVGPTMPHSAFVAANPYQPSQWVDNEKGAVAYDPSVTYQTTLSTGPVE